MRDPWHVRCPQVQRLYPTLSLVIECCTIQAALTHSTANGINAAVAAALMTHYFLYNLDPKKDLGIFLEEHMPRHWANPWTGEVKSKGWISMQAAVTALLPTNSMSDLLKRCIQFSGDVDTVAAITQLCVNLEILLRKLVLHAA